MEYTGQSKNKVGDNMSNEVRAAIVGAVAGLIGALVGGATTYFTAELAFKRTQESKARKEVAGLSVRLHYLIDKYRDWSGGYDGKVTEPEWNNIRAMAKQEGFPFVPAVANYLSAFAQASSTEPEKGMFSAISRLGSHIHARVLDPTTNNNYEPSQGLDIYKSLDDLKEKLGKMDRHLGILTVNP